MFGESLPPQRLPAAPTSAGQQAAVTPLPGQRSIDSATLLGPGGELYIHHGEQVYRLRLTSLGKLILTK